MLYGIDLRWPLCPRKQIYVCGVLIQPFKYNSRPLIRYIVLLQENISNGTMQTNKQNHMVVNHILITLAWEMSLVPWVPFKLPPGRISPGSLSARILYGQGKTLGLVCAIFVTVLSACTKGNYKLFSCVAAYTLL